MNLLRALEILILVSLVPILGMIDIMVILVEFAGMTRRWSCLVATAITLCGFFCVLHDFGWATTFLELMSMSFLPNSMRAMNILYELCFTCFEVCKTSFKLY